MPVVFSQEYSDYIDSLQRELNRAYEVAREARLQGLDPSDEVEVKIAKDVASRVEALVGPPGIADHIRSLEEGGMNREGIAFELTSAIASGKMFNGTARERIAQGVRTGVGILTEGMLVAPTEGISDVTINTNPDGTSYISVFFAGPIRSAGGTVAALAVALADHARKVAGVGDFRATDSEAERYVEEVNFYESKISHLQYKPSDEDVRWIAKNCPICIDGDPHKDKVEMSVHRDLPRIKTNYVRGGVPLVVCEGLAQKAAKVHKISKKYGLGWDWLENIIKIKRKESRLEIKPDYTYLEGLVAGRVVIAYPSAKGGFRLRYGKSRTNGLMAKNMHPATLALLEDFIAIGTHIKLERPGKGAVVTPCDSIEPPVVLLKNGSVRKVKSYSEGKALLPEVAKILFLGDMLVNYGDFVKSGHPLMPSGWCAEWWQAECAAKNVAIQEFKSAEDAFAFSRTHGIPLHPDYVFMWQDLTAEDVRALSQWLCTGEPELNAGKMNSFSAALPGRKDLLEMLCIDHDVENGRAIVRGDNAYALLSTLGMDFSDGKISPGKLQELYSEKKGACEMLSELCGAIIKPNAPTYIGARMGRPEKSKERIMKRVTGLFPTGSAKMRDLASLAQNLKASGTATVRVEAARFVCQGCGNITCYRKCELCSGKAVPQNRCKCGRYTYESNHCGAGVPVYRYDERDVPIVSLLDMLRRQFGPLPDNMRGVEGLFTGEKMPERLEKCLFRSRHGVYTFKDGTARHDSIDVPVTHLKPVEISCNAARLRTLGYTKDYLGAELSDEHQIFCLNPQDILISEKAGDYFVRVANFVDDLLAGMYGMKPFYNVKTRDDLIGHMFVGLSPHTSSGVLVRLIGFCKGNVGFGHPYFHAAKRRNTDGDEDAVMLLLDMLLNFSRHFLNDGRGGTMDAPITLSTIIDPGEIDDEAHNIELVSSYPLELYRLSETFASPNEVKIRTVKDALGKPEQYFGMGLTHQTSWIEDGPLRTNYLTMRSVRDKAETELRLAEKIRAVDVKDMCERLIHSHFIPDLFGNLRKFASQKFRCVDCNASYIRPPLVGKCTNPRCGGKIILTVHRGSITKYLPIAKELVARYGLPDYVRQRLELVEKEIDSIFEDEKSKQQGLSDFM
jgi:DNA polymerase II large subunit